MRVEISYLGEIEMATGDVHQGWAGGLRSDMTRVPTRHVEPTVVDVPDMPVPVHAGWGDRGESTVTLAVWSGIDADGFQASDSDEGVRVTLRTYAADERPAWLPAFEAAVVAIREAAAQAERDRPDVAAVCAADRASLARIRLDSQAHRDRWERDAVAIAQMFRRARVEVGEQTVPGKHVVRGARGTVLGYANCWDGRWLGTVERR